MISGPGSKGVSSISPNLLVSPRNQTLNQCFPLNSNNGLRKMRGFQQELNRPQLSGCTQNNGSLGLLKRLGQNTNSEIKLVMSKGADYCENHGGKVAYF